MNRDQSVGDDGLLEGLRTTITNHEPPTFAQYRALEPLANRHFVRALLRDRLLVHEMQRSRTLTTDLRALNDLALREAALETRRNVTLVSIIEALSAAEVPSLVFKGSALAHSLYPKPELRERHDTDLAVIHSHLQVADRVLGRLDFQAIAGNEGSLIMRQRLYRRRDADGLAHNIDLHWAISNSPRTNRLSVRDLLARSRELAALGTHARMPSITDSFLIACAHLDAHHVHDVRLVWLYDLHRMIAQMPVGIRARASRKAIEYELEGACVWMLALLEQTLGTSLTGFDTLLASTDADAPGQVASHSGRANYALCPTIERAPAGYGNTCSPLHALYVIRNTPTHQCGDCIWQGCCAARRTCHAEAAPACATLRGLCRTHRPRRETLSLLLRRWS